jgi:hypothetical protein
MRLHALLGIVSLALYTVPALGQQSPRWLPVATDNNNVTTFYDATSLVKQAGLTSVRTYHRLNSPKENGATQEITKYRFACGRNIGTIESISGFDDDNRLIDYVVNEQVKKLTPIAKKSLSSGIYRYACFSRR